MVKDFNLIETLLKVELQVLNKIKKYRFKINNRFVKVSHQKQNGNLPAHFFLIQIGKKNKSIK